MSNNILLVTVLLGLTTTCLSLVLGVYFRGFNNNLSKAFAWMLGGEAVMGAVTVIFASVALWNHGSTSVLTPEAQTALRWIAFICSGTTTLHLAKVVRDI